MLSCATGAVVSMVPSMSAAIVCALLQMCVGLPFISADCWRLVLRMMSEQRSGGVLLDAAAAGCNQGKTTGMIMV